MTKIGLGLPGISVADVRESAAVASAYDYDSFSVYGDLGDLPPYAVLHAAADELTLSNIPYIGPMGVPVGMMHPEVITGNAITLAQQLPGQTSIGLVRGAFLDQIGEKPASLAQMRSTVEHIRRGFDLHDIDTPPIYLGGFGPRLLRMAGELAVDGVKLGGSVNPRLAEKARDAIDHSETSVVLGAVSVIDADRNAARCLARHEVAKYLAVVGDLDTTLSIENQESLQYFNRAAGLGDPEAYTYISDALLDSFALAGTPEDALSRLEAMHGKVDRFEFGTPHGLHGRPQAIQLIGKTILNQL
jgi:5,10-methylenetetrahydromethanopterin reductase